jgi:hypothetical protein
MDGAKYLSKQNARTYSRPWKAGRVVGFGVGAKLGASPGEPKSLSTHQTQSQSPFLFMGRLSSSLTNLAASTFAGALGTRRLLWGLSLWAGVGGDWQPV